MTPIAILLLSLLQAPPPALPSEWTLLGEVEFRDGVSGLIFEDAVPVSNMPARQCRFRRLADGMRGTRVASALLIDADGRLLDVVPAPHVCEPLRRYLARLYPVRLSGRLIGRPGAPPAWYRIETTFSWSD